MNGTHAVPKRMLRQLLPATAAMATILLAGCASGPSQIEAETAYYGRDILQDECEQLAGDAIRPRLKDPYSAIFSFQACQKGWLSSVPIMGYPVEYGYFLKGAVNAKNSFGGYTGQKSFVVLMRDGRAVRAALADSEGMMTPWRP